jgi:hypothetical protein
MADHDDTSDDTSHLAKPPKRGAFPTPQHEIDIATPFIPDADEIGEHPNDGPEVNDHTKVDD